MIVIRHQSSPKSSFLQTLLSGHLERSLCFNSTLEKLYARSLHVQTLGNFYSVTCAQKSVMSDAISSFPCKVTSTNITKANQGFSHMQIFSVTDPPPAQKKNKQKQKAKSSLSAPSLPLSGFKMKP